MMKQFTFKAVVSYLLVTSIFVLMFAWIPSRHSLVLTFLMVFVAVAGLVCGVITTHRRSTTFRLAQFLFNLPSLFYLVTLRMWDRFAGLSWVFILVSLAGVVGVSLFPYVNKRLSGILYREQHAPRTKIGAWIFLSLPGILFIILVIGAVSIIVSFHVGKEPDKDTFTSLFVALLFYLATLILVFHAMYRHANDLWIWHTHSK